MNKGIWFAIGLGLAGCSAQGLSDLASTANRIAPELQSACNDALAVANLAGLVPGVGAIVPYINAGCATAQGLTKLAADPTSLQWLGQLIGQGKALASKVGIKV